MFAYRRLLVPLDGSPLARSAIPHAIAIAGRAGAEGSAEIVLLRVIEPIGVPRGGVGAAHERPVASETVQKLMADARHAAREDLETVQSRLLAEGVPSVHTETAEGRASDAILQRARALDCDLIVMGTRGHSGLKRLMIGSVADHVMHHATVPVLLVRPDA